MGKAPQVDEDWVTLCGEGAMPAETSHRENGTRKYAVGSEFYLHFAVEKSSHIIFVRRLCLWIAYLVTHKDKRYHEIFSPPRQVSSP